MPFFVPFVISQDNSAKKGLITSLIFSAGRLVVYMAVGLLIFFIFTSLFKSGDTEPDLRSFPLMHIVVGFLVVIYALWLLLKLPFPKVCPARFARGMVGLLVGMLLGAFICPPFIFMLVSNLGEPVYFFVLAVLLFWLGSSVSILLLGAGAGFVSKHVYKRVEPEKIQNIMHMVLILVGIMFFIVPGYMNLLSSPI
jgi:sulfite exporter TauE/SafE